MVRRRRKQPGGLVHLIVRALFIAPTVMLVGAAIMIAGWPALAIYERGGGGRLAALAEAAYLAVALATVLIFRWSGRAFRRHRRAAAQKRYAAQQYRLAVQSGLAEIDEMTGIRFERFVAARLQSAGWNVTATSASNDYGVDLIAQNLQEIVAVQCKRHSRAVGVRAVQEVVAGGIHYSCARTIVVSNQEFTRQARVLAATSNCELIGRDRLPRWLRQT